jgi:hypothetical protein
MEVEESHVKQEEERMAKWLGLPQGKNEREKTSWPGNDSEDRVEGHLKGHEKNDKLVRNSKEYCPL